MTFCIYDGTLQPIKLPPPNIQKTIHLLPTYPIRTRTTWWAVIRYDRNWGSCDKNHVHHCIDHQLQGMHHNTVCNTALIHWIRASLGDEHASVGCRKGSEAAMWLWHGVDKENGSNIEVDMGMSSSLSFMKQLKTITRRWNIPRNVPVAGFVFCHCVGK